jgi:predicted ArsR family transcriptional regulator
MTVARDYNVLREPEVIAEEMELIRLFGQSSRGGVGTVDKPMTRTIEKTRIDRWTQGAMPSSKSRLGKLVRQWMNRKPPVQCYKVEDNDEYAACVHHLRLGLGLEGEEEEMMKNKQGLTREDVMKVLVKGGNELSTAEVGAALKVGADDVRGLLDGLAKDGVINRRKGSPGDHGGRAPIFYGSRKSSKALAHDLKVKIGPSVVPSARTITRAPEVEEKYNGPLADLMVTIQQAVEDYVENEIEYVVNQRVEKKVAEIMESRMQAVRAALLPE